MTTIAVVQKDGFGCIAADSVTSFGDMALTDRMAVDKRKVLRVGDVYLGLSGSSAHYAVLESYFADRRSPRRFGTRREIFETWRRLHDVLKDRYYLNPKDEASDPYESSQITALILTPRGLFGVFALREVFQYSRFWAMGSGREYALGALEALYDLLPTAREIAEAAVLSACAFDKGTGPPVESHVIRMAAPERRPTGKRGHEAGGAVLPDRRSAH